MLEINQDKVNDLVSKAFKNTLGQHKYARPFKYTANKDEPEVTPEEIEVIGEYKSYEVGIGKPNVFIRVSKYLEKLVHNFKNRNSLKRTSGYSAYVINKKQSWWKNYLSQRAIRKTEQYRSERSKRVRIERAKLDKIIPSNYMSSKGEFRFRDPDKQVPADLR